MPSRLIRPLLFAGAALALSTPALAHEPPTAEAAPAAVGAHPAHPGYDTAAYERARAGWLAECRRRHGSGSGKTIGGAVGGGLIGGLIGNRVAGRGNRTEGTIIGTAVGAAAGGAIGADADRREAQDARDYCESYLDQYASYGQGGHGYGYAMQPVMMMVPVAMVQAATPTKPRECVEEVVTEEYDEPAARIIPPPRRVPPPKRVRDKRVRVN